MLFRSIAGLVHIDSGEINVFGRIIGRDISFPDNMGLIIENVGFWPQFTSIECLETLRRVNKVIPKSGMYDALNRVGLDPYDNRKYSAFSLGMRQKLAIAQAIMEKPSLLILDEPGNGLDDTSIDRLSAILQEEKDRGALILLASHDNDLLTNLSNNVIRISAGRIV